MTFGDGFLRVALKLGAVVEDAHVAALGGRAALGLVAAFEQAEDVADTGIRRASGNDRAAAGTIIALTEFEMADAGPPSCRGPASVSGPMIGPLPRLLGVCPALG